MKKIVSVNLRKTTSLMFALAWFVIAEVSNAPWQIITGFVTSIFFFGLYVFSKDEVTIEEV